MEEFTRLNNNKTFEKGFGKSCEKIQPRIQVRKYWKTECLVETKVWESIVFMNICLDKEMEAELLKIWGIFLVW